MMLSSFSKVVLAHLYQIDGHSPLVVEDELCGWCFRQACGLKLYATLRGRRESEKLGGEWRQRESVPVARLAQELAAEFPRGQEARLKTKVDHVVLRSRETGETRPRYSQQSKADLGREGWDHLLFVDRL